jgi:hypothetical protein
MILASSGAKTFGFQLISFDAFVESPSNDSTSKGRLN